ncbi:MAG: PfkB family carbohydrate kinase, partial [Candidatus Omnitrophota bacterium]|nr:PfkB family carbohydrate kinase [Candidatus Omnitrophota bacterium]
LVDEAVTRSSSGQRVVMGANSSPRAGGVYPDGDLMDLGEVAGLLPMNGHDAPIDWIWRSSGQAISVGIRRNSERTTFVVEGSRDAPQTLREAGNRIIALLNDPQLSKDGLLPDYNSWVSVREDGVMRLHIRPRSADFNSLHGQPVADQDYRLVHWERGGRTRLMNEEELEKIGGSHMAPEIDVNSGPKLERIVIPQGKRIFDFAIDTPALLGLILSQNADDYNNPHLPALMEQGLELASVPWSHARIGAVRKSLEAEPGNDLQSVFEQEKAEVQATWDNVSDVQDFIRRVEEVRDAGLRHQEAFNALTPQERNAYTSRFWELLQQFGRDERVKFEVAPHSEPTGEPPRNNTPQVVALGLPTLDLITEVVGAKGEEVLTVRLKAGGFSAHVAQALLAMGVPHHLIAAFGGETGQAARQALAGIPVTEPFEFLTRISIMFPRAGNRVEIRLVSPGQLEPLTPEQIRSFWEQIPSVTNEKPPVVVFGERFPGQDQESSAQAWAEGMRQTKVPVYVSINSSWTPGTIGTILSANPRGVFVTPEGLAQAAGKDLSSWRSRPEDMAYLAYQLRRTHQLSGWVLVALPTGGLVLVNGEGWWHVAPSPLHQLTYISGAADTAYLTFLEALLHESQAVAAAEQAVTASAIFMGRDPADRGLPPTQVEGAGVFTPASWPVIVDALPIPQAVREEQDRDLQQLIERSEKDAINQSAKRFLDHLASRPAAGAAAAEQQSWWQGLSFHLSDAVHALEGTSRRTIMRELLGIATDPGGPEGVRSTARRILSELPEQVWEADVDPERALLYGQIFHHQRVTIPAFMSEAVGGTHLISDDLATAAVNLTAAKAGEMDLAVLAPDTVGGEVEDWDKLLRSRRLEGVQISSAALEKLSDFQLAAAFRRRIQEALSTAGGLVIIQDVDVKTEADGQRRLFIYV